MRVLALEQAVAGPLCTRHLADLGADVVKIERPGGGDFARRYDTAVKGLSSYFVWLNRGKRSLTLDMKHPGATAILERLVASSDVLVQNLGPGAIDRLGFAPERLRRDYPALVITSISGYGAGGPYENRKAFDLLLQGETGVIATTGNGDDLAKVGISVGDIGAAVYGTIGTLAALYERRSPVRVASSRPRCSTPSPSGWATPPTTPSTEASRRRAPACATPPSFPTGPTVAPTARCSSPCRRRRSGKHSASRLRTS